MNCGKVPGNVLKRSVINLIGKGPRTGVDAAVYPIDMQQDTQSETGNRVFSSTQTGVTDNKLAAFLAVVKACNNILAAGGAVIGVSAAFLLSERTKERDLKNLTRQTMAGCKMYHTELSGGHTEVSDGVNRAMSTVTAIGYSNRECVYTVRDLTPGMDIVMTKWAGLEEAAILLSDEDTVSRLSERFSKYYMGCFEDYSQWLSIEEEAKIVSQLGEQWGKIIMHDNSDGGIFASLWDMAEGSGLGFEVDLRKIPVRQEIIELAYFFEKNIYRMKSSGSLLIACKEGGGFKLCEVLAQQGIPAALIGQFTSNNDKIIRNEDEIRYLERV